MPLPKTQTDTYTSEQYWNLPDGQRAELINGRLYAMAPPSRVHQEIITELVSAIHDHIKKITYPVKSILLLSQSIWMRKIKTR